MLGWWEESLNELKLISSSKGDLLKQIKERLKQEYNDICQEWELKGFDVDHLFTLTQSHSQITIEVTLLNLAAENGYLDLVETLLDNDANINKKTVSGFTSLHFAAANGHSDVVLALLENDASINERTSSGLTPLHFAAANGHSGVVLALLENDASINERTSSGLTPLHLAAENGHLHVVDILLKVGIVLEDAKKDSKCTSLNFPAANDHFHRVKILLKEDVNEDSKCTPLHFAAANGNSDVVLALLKNGASINERTSTGRTPLHFAAANGYSDVVEVLLNKGASTNEKENNGFTSLHFAAANGYFDIVEVLLDKGASVSEKTLTGDTPLSLAAAFFRLYVVEILLDNSANKEEGKDGFTSLHFAAMFNCMDKLEYLLEKDYDVNKETAYGCTPLHFAAENGHFRMVAALLSNGAEVNKKTVTGLTPLHLAAENGHFDIVKMLLRENTNLNARDKYDRTASDLAKSDKMRSLLIKRGEVVLGQGATQSTGDVTQTGDTNGKQPHNLNNGGVTEASTQPAGTESINKNSGERATQPTQKHLAPGKDPKSASNAQGNSEQPSYTDANNPIQKNARSKLPVVTASVLAVSGVVLGIAIAVHFEMLTVGIAVGTCCLVAAAILYYCDKQPNSLEINSVHKVNDSLSSGKGYKEVASSARYSI